MERWVGRVALVTGASSGFGEAIAKSLVEHGMKVVGCARNIAKIQSLAESLNNAKGSLSAIQCDISKDDQIQAMFDQIKKQYGGVDVCINNAGLSHDAPLLSGTTEQWRHMFDVNVIGLMTCTRETVKSMRDRGVEDGHIFLLSSMSGHRLVPDAPSIHCYAATKYAVRALTEGLRNELHASGSHIRVTGISPGMAKTEFTERMYPDNPELVKAITERYEAISPGLARTDFSHRLYSDDHDRANSRYEGIETLTSEDIADSVVYALGAPTRVQIHDLLIRPTECKY